MAAGDGLGAAVRIFRQGGAAEAVPATERGELYQEADYVSDDSGGACVGGAVVCTGRGVLCLLVDEKLDKVDCGGKIGYGEHCLRDTVL